MSEKVVKRRRPKRVRRKTEVVAFRLVPGFKRMLEQLALNEGLDLSAWMRNLVLKELKSRGMIRESPTVGPALEEALLGAADEKRQGEEA